MTAHYSCALSIARAELNPMRSVCLNGSIPLGRSTHKNTDLIISESFLSQWRSRSTEHRCACWNDVSFFFLLALKSASCSVFCWLRTAYVQPYIFIVRENPFQCMPDWGKNWCGWANSASKSLVPLPPRPAERLILWLPLPFPSSGHHLITQRHLQIATAISSRRSRRRGESSMELLLC